MTQQMRDRLVKMEHFANLVAIAYADGVLDESEKTFLSIRAKEIGMNMNEVKILLEHADELQIAVPLNHEEIEEQIADSVYMAMVDGHIDDREYELVHKIAQKLEFSENELDHMIDLVAKLWKDQSSNTKN